MRYLIFVFIFIVLLFSAILGRAQSLNGSVLRLTPTSLSITCNNGDMRVDANDSYKLKKCGLLNAWAEISPTGVLVNPMTTNGDLITQSAGVVARVGIGTANAVLTSSGSAVGWAKLLDANLDTAAAIDATKIADGSVTSTEFQYINTLSSNAQTQLNSKPNTATLSDNRLIRADGTAAIQSSGITVSDADAITGASSISSTVFLGPLTGNVTGSLTGNADTATALAANPADCAADTYATTIAASGALTCATVTSAGLAGNVAVNKLVAQTASRVATFDGSGFLAPSSVTTTTLGFLDVGSSLTTLLAAKAPLASPTFTGTVTGPFTTAGPVITTSGGVLSSEAALAIARGGTNNASLAVTAGGTFYSDGSKFINTGAGSTGQILTSNGSSAPTWQAAPAGGTNDQKEYISNGKFETDTTGWSMYADAAAAAPVDCTGGSPASTGTRTTTAGEVIRDSASYEIAKSAANRQGEGASYDFVLDFNDYNNLRGVPISFEYNNTANLATGDILVYVYDKDAGGSPQPIATIQSSTPGTVTSSVGGTRFNGMYYPTTITSNDYRLCIHIATTNATAYDLHLDSVHIGNQNATPGAIVTDLGTETWVDSFTNATTAVKLQRVGNRIFADGKTTLTGVGSTGLTFTIPAAYTATDSAEVLRVGTGTAQDTGVTSNTVGLYMTAVNTITVYIEGASGTYVSQANPTSTAPFTWGSGDFVHWQASWIVSGWSASTAYNTTEALWTSAAFKATKVGTQNVGASTPTKVTGWTVNKDTVNGWDSTNNRWTAPRTGRYDVDAALETGNATAENFFIHVYVNGSSVAYAFTPIANPNLKISIPVDVIKGDYIEVFVDSTADTAYDVNAVTASYFAITANIDLSIFSVYGVTDYSSSTAAATNLPATTTFGDLTSISLTAGEWDLGANCLGHRNTASEAAWTVFGCGISTTTGNSSTGLSLTSNYMRITQSFGLGSDAPLHVSGYRVQPTATTTYYLKYTGTYSANQPQAEGTIYARKIK